jgi:hypothetical protein
MKIKNTSKKQRIFILFLGKDSPTKKYSPLSLKVDLAEKIEKQK